MNKLNSKPLPLLVDTKLKELYNKEQRKLDYRFGRAVNGWYVDGDPWSAMVPQSLHGFMGPVGFGLMVFMTRLGKQARSQREAGESFAVAKLKHGRAADLIIYLVFINAFLGFIYTFDVLM